MQPTIISILGRPVSGKDTQAQLLLRELPNAEIISTGAMIREVKETGPTHRFWPILGPEIATMDQGILISEEAINQTFEQVVHEKLAEGVQTLIVTAHPRMPGELTSFDAMVRREGLWPVFVCLDTSEAYVRELHKTRNHNRVDDDEALLTTRMAEYDAHSKPVIDRLRREGRLVTVNGEGPDRESVHRRMMDALRPHVPDPEITLPAMARR